MIGLTGPKYTFCPCNRTSSTGRFSIRITICTSHAYNIHAARPPPLPATCWLEALSLFEEKKKKMSIHAARQHTVYTHVHIYIYTYVCAMLSLGIYIYEPLLMDIIITGPVKCFCQTFVAPVFRPETIVVNTRRWEKKKVTSSYLLRSKRVTDDRQNSSRE